MRIEHLLISAIALSTAACGSCGGDSNGGGHATVDDAQPRPHLAGWDGGRFKRLHRMGHHEGGAPQIEGDSAEAGSNDNKPENKP